MAAKKFNAGAVFSLTNVKKEFAQIQSSRTGHTELNMAMYGEKCMVEAMEKVIAAKSAANDLWVKWAEKEESGPIREMTLKITELDDLWIAVHQDYAETYNIQRKLYKQVLKGEQSVDDLKKQYEETINKVKKAQRQYDSAVKTKDKKLATYASELQKAVQEQETLARQLETRKMNHAIFKYGKFREAFKPVLDFQMELHAKCLEIAMARRQILELYTGQHYHNMTPDNVLNASVGATNTINDTAAKIGADAAATALKRQASGSSSHSSDASWTDDATYQGIAEETQEAGAGDRDSCISQSQRPLPDLPHADGDARQSQRILPDSEEVYEYVEPRLATDHDGYLALKSNTYDNSEISDAYLPMERSSSSSGSSAHSSLKHSSSHDSLKHVSSPGGAPIPAPREVSRQKHPLPPPPRPQRPGEDAAVYDMAWDGGQLTLSANSQK